MTPRPVRAGPKRRVIRERVASLVEMARAHHWSSTTLRATLRHELEGVRPKSYARLVWREELRRAGVPLRGLPDFRQLSLFPEALR